MQDLSANSGLESHVEDQKDSDEDSDDSYDDYDRIVAKIDQSESMIPRATVNVRDSFFYSSSNIEDSFLGKSSCTGSEQECSIRF